MTQHWAVEARAAIIVGGVGVALSTPPRGPQHGFYLWAGSNGEPWRLIADSGAEHCSAVIRVKGRQFWVFGGVHRGPVPRWATRREIEIADGSRRWSAMINEANAWLIALDGARAHDEVVVRFTDPSRSRIAAEAVPVRLDELVIA